MSNDNLLREVDDELRRDRLRKLWRQAAPFVIGGAIAVVLGVAGYEGWTWWQKTQSSQASDQFYAAAKIADGTDLAAAKTALDGIIASSSGGYPMLAQFREAALLAQNGKTDEAVAAYDGLATSIGNPHLRELALILAGNLLIDKGDVAAVEQRVGSSLIPSSPLRNAAREAMGLVQYKAGKIDDANKSFQAIIDDPLATQELRSRIGIYQLQLQAEGAAPIVASSEASTEASNEVSSASSEAPVASSSEASVASSFAAEVSSAASASAAVDASTELDVTPPAVIDNSLLSMAAPAEANSSSSLSSEPLALSNDALSVMSSAP